NAVSQVARGAYREALRRLAGPATAPDNRPKLCQEARLRPAPRRENRFRVVGGKSVRIVGLRVGNVTIRIRPMKRWLTGIVALGFTAVALLPLSAAERRGAVETIDAFIKAVKENKELPADKVESAVAVAEELKADPPSHSAV